MRSPTAWRRPGIGSCLHLPRSVPVEVGTNNKCNSSGSTRNSAAASKTQTVLPCAETVPMLLWALLASGQNPAAQGRWMADAFSTDRTDQACPRRLRSGTFNMPGTHRQGISTRSEIRPARTIAADNLPSDTAFSRTKGKVTSGRSGCLRSFSVGDALAGTEWQPFIKTVIRITRSTLLYSAATGLWHQRQETAFYVSSAADYPATEWAAAIRGHLGNRKPKSLCPRMSPATRIKAGSGIIPASWRAPEASPATSCAKNQTSQMWRTHSGVALSASIISSLTKKSD